MANSGVEYKMDGLDALMSRLKTVQDDIKIKGGRFALRKAANLLRDQVKANARRLDDPQTAQSIAENVAVRWSGRTFKRTGNLKFRVGIMGGASGRKAGSGPGGDTWYWRLLEFGTSKMPARPFMRPAINRAAGDVTREFINQYGRALDRALKRAGTKR